MLLEPEQVYPREGKVTKYFEGGLCAGLTRRTSRNFKYIHFSVYDNGDFEYTTSSGSRPLIFPTIGTFELSNGNWLFKSGRTQPARLELHRGEWEHKTPWK